MSQDNEYVRDEEVINCCSSLFPTNSFVVVSPTDVVGFKNGVRSTYSQLSGPLLQLYQNAVVLAFDGICHYDALESTKAPPGKLVTPPQSVFGTSWKN